MPMRLAIQTVNYMIGIYIRDTENVEKQLAEFKKYLKNIRYIYLLLINICFNDYRGV